MKDDNPASRIERSDSHRHTGLGNDESRCVTSWSRVRVCGIAVALTATAFLLTGCHTTMHDVLSSYGYSEIRPPSTLIPPGTMITIDSADPLTVGVICPAVTAFGTSVSQSVLSSPSTTSSIARKMTNSFNLSASYLSELGLDLSSNQMKSVTLDLTNVRLQELPDDIVFQLVGNRAAGCASALEFRRSKAQRVSMIKAVLIADAKYHVDFSEKADAKIRADVTKKVAIAFGLSTESATEDTIVGKDLIYGVRDDELLASVSATKPPPTRGTTRPGLLSAGAVVKIVNKE